MHHVHVVAKPQAWAQLCTSLGRAGRHWLLAGPWAARLAASRGCGLEGMGARSAADVEQACQTTRLVRAVGTDGSEAVSGGLLELLEEGCGWTRLWASGRGEHELSAGDGPCLQVGSISIYSGAKQTKGRRLKCMHPWRARRWGLWTMPTMPGFVTCIWRGRPDSMASPFDSLTAICRGGLRCLYLQNHGSPLDLLRLAS